MEMSNNVLRALEDVGDNWLEQPEAHWLAIKPKMQEFVTAVRKLSKRARTRSHAYKVNLKRDRRGAVRRNERPNTKPHKRKFSLWAPESDSD
jgi:hypothetical protein